ncbi:MAG: S-adenosylmethionine:tRNA ribosyltransferase-isomerase [Prevotellaceae bacterium]|jgi:S-adenosylmethionine:tRNA ribosyltransferase-isomerase|nr:S-adenosylmethionine:tRNA ribosyltransferase-isomerase [Prevotellaceae bacterium]
MQEYIPKISVKDYRYDLPDNKIAKYPLDIRDRSKLLLYQNGEISEHAFTILPDILTSDTALVFNNSKVIRARIAFRKNSGAGIEVFCLSPASPRLFDAALSAVGKCSWNCTVGNAKRWKDEPLEKEFKYKDIAYKLTARKTRLNNEFLVDFEWDAPVSFSVILDCCGEIPIPPYLGRNSEKIDEVSYQTVYSKHEGSVAAPTAGLHFSDGVLAALQSKNISIEEITLHVGAGTFKPMKGEFASEHKMHRETFIINRSGLERLYLKSDNLVAVGTTSARMLESLYWLGVTANTRECYETEQWDAYRFKTDMSVKDAFERIFNKMDKNGDKTVQATTQIMIVPGYEFKTVKGLITNFHQPESTLILLVAAFIGDKWKDIYDYALNHDFRFLSYGDCSFLTK